jgi:hypothetical protein
MRAWRLTHFIRLPTNGAQSGIGFRTPKPGGNSGALIFATASWSAAAYAALLADKCAFIAPFGVLVLLRQRLRKNAS